jgi:hypothetical protein
MFKVRFHLGAGEHYKHWQIRTTCKGKPDRVEYEDPAKVQLELVTCTLRSKTGVAKKVLASQVRDVCGWVECEHVITNYLDIISVQDLPRVTYDPKLNPYWKIEGDSDNYETMLVAELVTSGNKLYILKSIYV